MASSNIINILIFFFFLDSFHRNLRIKSFFEPERQTKLVSSTSTPNLFTTTPADSVPSDVERAIAKSKVLKPCKKMGPPPGPIHLEAVILTNEINLNKTFVRAPNNLNVSRDEKAALKTLASDHSIVIKPADKGGATVIQNREDYIREGERQLSDSLLYQPLDQ